MSEHPSRFDFSSIANSYDAWYETALGRVCDVLEKRAVQRMLPRPKNGARLLDVGCGTGHWARFFSDLGFRVTGIDCSPAMVHVASAKEIPNASFEVADAHVLPLGDHSFDVAAAITTLEFGHSPTVVVREMVRCTRRPGGVVLLGVLNPLCDLNRIRKATGKPPYSSARLFSPNEVQAMLYPYGDVRVATTTFVPRSTWLLPLARLTDAVSRLLRLRHGAFVVGRAVL